MSSRRLLVPASPQEDDDTSIANYQADVVAAPSLEYVSLVSSREQ